MTSSAARNRLDKASSPYLLQHQDNPVHWFAWSREALNEAKRQNKPILLSVGYAACHWCHVMAHESFEDDEVAAIMNAHFVNIKVDREERPDIDAIYMSALHLLGEQGGWPLTMFLTPDAEPFWGGTYFPKTPRFGRPGFVQVLTEVARIFREEPEKVETNRLALRQRLDEQARTATPGTLSPALADELAPHLLKAMDPRHGGLQGAPKFPQTSLLELLWRRHLGRGEAAFGEAVRFALERMSIGGIYDHLGGGFSRYSVDERWLAPHFEKMLYDNGLLIDLMSEVHRATASPILAARVAETIVWLEEEMRTETGAYAASLDADSEGEEGKFYVWTANEIDRLLGPEEAAFFAAHYDVTPGGNWEGKTILNRLSATSLADEATERRLADLRERLKQARSLRIRPGLDDKLLADWNGMAIAGLAKAAFVFAEPAWLDIAKRVFAAIVDNLGDGERLAHSWRAGEASSAGLLADYAWMTKAALALYERTADIAYLNHAITWTETIERHFRAEQGGYHMSAEDADDLIVRPLSAADEAVPNANAVTATNQSRLAGLTGDPAYLERASALFSAFAEAATRNALAHAGLVNALNAGANMAEAIIVGGDGPASGGASGGASDAAPDRASYEAALRRRSFPDLFVQFIADGAALPEGHPAKGKANQGPAAFVCRNQSCSLPLADADQVIAALDSR